MYDFVFATCTFKLLYLSLSLSDLSYQQSLYYLVAAIVVIIALSRGMWYFQVAIGIELNILTSKAIAPNYSFKMGEGYWQQASTADGAGKLFTSFIHLLPQTITSTMWGRKTNGTRSNWFYFNTIDRRLYPSERGVLSWLGIIIGVTDNNRDLTLETGRARQ